MNKILLTALLFLASLVFFTGCKTTPPKVDWEGRVGKYTYDQAVAELGPPEKSAKLSDGKTVAEWVVGRGSSPSFGIGLGSYSPGIGVGVGQTIGGGNYDKILRLDFDANGELIDFKMEKR